MAKFKLDYSKFNELNDAAPDGQKFEDVDFAWRNDGRMRDGRQLSMNDIVTLHESPLFIARSITNQIQEAVEPMLIATSLLEEIPYKIGTYIDLPVMGSMTGDFRVGEEESYPEFNVAYGQGAQISKIGKYGLAMRFTEEILRYSQFDVISIYLRQAGYALARYREEQIFAMWRDVAYVTHDNAAPLVSAHGTTTGRDLTGALNGSFTMDDLFEMYSSLLHKGFQPDLLMVHPLTWLMFVQDAQLRHFAQMSGTPWFQGKWTGSPARNDFRSYQGGLGETGSVLREHPGATNSTGGAGPQGSTSNPMDFSHNLDSAPVIPGYFGIPLRIVVSPFVEFDAVNNTTTIMMADSAELGFFIRDHDVMVREWENYENDVLKMKLTERYSLAPKNRGNGIAVAKNVVVTSNQIILPAQSQISVAGSIDIADRKSPI